MKLNDYHAIIDCILDEFKILQHTGFHFNLKTKQNTSFPLVFKVVLQAVIYDCKGANYLTGQYGSHSEKCIGSCRDCNVKTIAADKCGHRCHFFSKREMVGYSTEQLNSLSFHDINNSFNHISFGKGYHNGIYGATPPEVLHVFHIGLCQYLYEGFVDKLNSEIKLQLDSTVKLVVYHMKNTVMIIYPECLLFQKVLHHDA